MTNPFQSGDILASEWGATMQMVSFYQVTKITKSMIELEQIKQQETPTGFLSGTTIPLPNQFRGRMIMNENPVLKRRWFHCEDGGPFVKINDFARAYRYDETKTYFFDHCD